ncbi:integrase core domain-containing protein [Oceanitalea stevensii]|uniref:Transposase n=1 Tax=Oceanitalea stevensii TaxID=2763072 RepID=A0ABR8Z5Z1_9MICO|nr:transposase [Oceanitalea stevensii]
MDRPGRTTPKASGRVARWVHWYNTQRLHCSIGQLPPVEFEARSPAGYDRDPEPEVV